jgi:broad specificity phosphatase PhoE
MNVNFAFLRHGYGCHNAMSNLVYYKVLSKSYANKFMERGGESKNILKGDILPLNDPVLTNVGVEASIYNGCIINKIIRRLADIYHNKNLTMDTFNVIGCSPLIRCMETAYYMTRKWKNPPNKIYVFPLLREIDESSVDKYSEESRETIRITPSYSIKSIQEQKDYLRTLGILDSFDFSFVETFPKERIEPGDIKEFISWFAKYFMTLLNTDNKNLNVFITTHAGVLRDYAGEGFYNNSGFVINTTYVDNFAKNTYVSLNNHIKEYNFFKDYSNEKYNTKEYYCPSNRCGQLCSVANDSGIKGSLAKIGLKCSIEDDNNNKNKLTLKIKRPKQRYHETNLNTIWNFD